MSILELQFDGSKQVIGHYELDIGKCANNNSNGQTFKQTIDLKSENYPGCQLGVNVTVKVIDPESMLPDDERSRMSIAVVHKVNPEQNKLEDKKIELTNKVKMLELDKQNAEQKKERLDFKLQ